MQSNPPAQRDPEHASAGMMALFVIGLLMMLFIWVLCGGVFEQIREMHNVTADLGDTMPVSDERVTTLNFLIIGMAVMPFIGILMPLLLYSIIMSVRKGSGGF